MDSSFVASEPLSSETIPNLSQEQEEFNEIYNHRSKWCTVSWFSQVFLVLSVVCIYFVISSMEDYYDVYQCLILSQCILVCIASMVGCMFSIRACCKVKSVKMLYFGTYKEQ
ncbi:Hypothetical_protein [Hexamita inflata]|uniref:Hypothetical_protein n=1 Tax=Hexamita inflata TaxID=28002 RepID=A0AA86PVR1_9EUKA|nr:Hypothetical protein HINF_LOCUS34804 [Hexamita inflata]